MKIRTVKKNYEDVIAITPKKHKKPKKTNMFFRVLLKLVSIPDLLAVRFRVRRIGMEKLGKREPCLFLMNHSSFIDLEIAASVLFPRPFNIVATTDSFVGKNWLMRAIGCFPTKKFVTELSLIRDITHVIENEKASVLMFPEAGYSFDGTSTTLPDSLGKFIKRLGSPVVMIETFGAFTRDPLYNNLQRRKVRVSADMTYILSPSQISELTAEQINDVLAERFSFDAFQWQKENQVRVTEPFRADFLNRVLYKCPSCMTEGKMRGKGDTLTCTACNRSYTLTELGELRSNDGDGAFTHVPSWFAWERECVKEEILSGKYYMSLPVDICILLDTKCLYSVGEGQLTHTTDGFHLVGCDGKLEYEHPALSSYSLNADFNWYEIGDVICIGNQQLLYYCFPKTEDDVVAKARLATEEIFKIAKAEQKARGRQSKPTDTQ